MDRRGLLRALLLAIPAIAFAQRKVSPRIGLLAVSLPSDLEPTLRSVLADNGFRSVTMLTMNLREYSELAPAVEEMIRQEVDLIVAFGSQAPMVAAKVTRTVPIIAIGGDVVANGLAKSYARPGGNVTGVSGRQPEVYPKHLEILRELLPRMKRVAVLHNPESPAEKLNLSRLGEEARRRNLAIQEIAVRHADELETQFAAAIKSRPDALVIISSTVFARHWKEIADLALKYRLPAIASNSDLKGSKILAVFGTNRQDLCRRGSAYAVRILNGALPAELPIDQATDFELVLNETTAATLGLKIPQALRVRATLVR